MTFNKTSLLGGTAMVAVLGAVLLSTPAYAAGSADDAKLEELSQQLQDLQGQIADLKRSQGAQYSDLTAKRDSDPKVTLDNGRPTFKTADGKFSASLRATVQYDTAFYFQDKNETAVLTPAFGRDLSDGTNFRRAQFGLDGIAFGDWSYSFIYDFGGSNGAEQQGRVSSAYIQYNGLAPFQFRIGAFAPFIGLEDSTSSADTLFAERPSASELSRANTGGDGRSAIQIAAIGDEYLASVSYSGSSSTTAAVFDEQQAVNARLAYLFYSDLDTKFVGSLSGVYEFDAPDTVAGSPGATNITLADRPELRVDGTQLITATIDADKLLVGGAELGLVWQNFYAQAGYFNYSVDRRASTLSDPNFDGWYVQGSWILTGESKPYDATRAAFRNPKPAQPLGFGDSPGFGAWEIAARYSVADLNYHENLTPALGGVRGGEQKIFTAGLHWYPNSIIKLLLDWQHVEIDRLNASAVAAAAPYPAIAAGADVGQSFDTINLRAQIAL